MKNLVATLLSAALLMACTAVHATERVTYYHNDALGSPIAATVQTGDVLWREEYRPYGERMIDEQPSAQPVAFTGKKEEESLGIQYFGARWYHPVLGRFLTIDPAPVQAENQWSFNRYAYANNNPYKYIDPDGRFAVQVAGGVVGFAIGAYNASQKQGASVSDIFVGGGIGVAVGVASTLGAGPLATAAFAGGSAAAGSAAQQAYDNGGSVDARKVLSDGAKGAAFGAIAGKLGQALSPKVVTEHGVSYTQGLLRPGETARQFPRPSTYGAHEGTANTIDLITGGTLGGADAYLSTPGDNQNQAEKKKND